MARFRSLRRRRSARRKHLDPTKSLFYDLWRITDKLEQYQIRAYQDHERDCRKVKDDPTIPCSSVDQVVRLCQLVNGSLTLPLDDAYQKFRFQYAPNAAQQQLSDRSIQQALEYAVQLCYFVPLSQQLRQGPQRLRDILLQELSECTSAGPNRILEDDFNEKNLTRRAGIKICYTSDLTRHLELGADGKELFVFRHGTALRAYEEHDARCDVYPAGFLSETQETIDLLFPVGKQNMVRRRARLSEKHSADLEVGPLNTPNGEPKRSLDAYTYWGHRLAIINDVYQASRPSRLKQWYYDRRDGVSFTTFWFALSAFVIAVIFGLISSVTSIMATWKAYHP